MGEPASADCKASWHRASSSERLLHLAKITLPDILSDEPVVIEDDGHGMKNQDVRQEYLKIASPRYSRKGERTPNLDRKVKGRRGIGKFSGLTIGDEMEIVTRAQGTQTTLLISKELLLEAGKNIEEVELPISEETCDPAALQHNLWIFGNEYSLMASNRQLQSIVRDFADKAYRDKVDVAA